ncbi:MAG: hypothetical protein NTZ94_16250 [Verrucomicrobia bacterium]|nr:hypothetical protein [Verrucomicrobiota bacterium]
MNVIIEIPEERAARYQNQAEARGLSIEGWFFEIADQNAAIPSISHLHKSNPKEWARQFRLWAGSHSVTLPVLSDEAMSRESIYSDCD